MSQLQYFRFKIKEDRKDRHSEIYMIGIGTVDEKWRFRGVLMPEGDGLPETYFDISHADNYCGGKFYPLIQLSPELELLPLPPSKPALPRL